MNKEKDHHHIDEDADEFDEGELHRALVEPQFGKGDNGQGVEANNEGEVYYIFGVIGHRPKLAEGALQPNHEGAEGQGGEEQGGSGGVVHPFLLGIAHKAEIRGFHAVGEDDVEEGDIGVYGGVFAVLAGAEHG